MTGRNLRKNKDLRGGGTYQDLITALIMANTVDAAALATFAAVDIETRSAEEAALVAVACDGHGFRKSGAAGAGGGWLEMAQEGGVSQLRVQEDATIKIEENETERMAAWIL